MANVMMWTTKDGKSIPVSQMETSHIVNALELMRRKMIALGEELCERTGRYNGFSEEEVNKLFDSVVLEHLRDLKSDMHG